MSSILPRIGFLSLIIMLALAAISCQFVAASTPTPDLEATQQAMAETEAAMEREQASPSPRATRLPTATATPVELSLTVDNQSSQEICFVYISDTESGSWGEDWLDGASIRTGGSRAFTLQPGVYDLLAGDCGGVPLKSELEFEIHESLSWPIEDPAAGQPLLLTEFNRDEASIADWHTYSIYAVPAVPQFNEGEFEVEIRNGVMYMLADTKGTYVYALYDQMAFGGLFRNVTVQAVVEKVGGPNRNNIALICRYSRDGWYEFAITSGGEWEAWRFQPGDGYTLMNSGGSGAIKLQFETNEMALDCVGDTLTLYVNGVEVGSATDSRLEAGLVGVAIFSFDIGGVEVEVDNFVVSYPGE